MRLSMADRETTREHRPHLMVADSPYLLLITAFSFALAYGRDAVPSFALAAVWLMSAKANITTERISADHT